jgi:hypothetical protein
MTAVDSLRNKLLNEFGFAFSDNIFEESLQMESQKQQKYDEMVAMLDGMCNVWNEVGINDYSMSNYMNLVQQLVKEAKEL